MSVETLRAELLAMTAQPLASELEALPEGDPKRPTSEALAVVGLRRREPSWAYWDRYCFTPWNEHSYAQAFAAALQARNAITAQDRPPAGDENRPAPPRPVDTTGPVDGR